MKYTDGICSHLSNKAWPLGISISAGAKPSIAVLQSSEQNGWLGSALTLQQARQASQVTVTARAQDEEL